ncbi:hypothetical protein [Sinorhizobium sp. BG8]|uniref:hypothetical protein n=1 Tax=Sinorhizobium sp. BG8 TaxID=2613773 RepID=UPI001FED2B3C|nr:hypothetical protein [Sinorhizobium sp. BG8]
MRIADYPEDRPLATAKDIATARPHMRESRQARHLPPALLEEAQFLRRMGISKPAISAAVISAVRNGTTAETELLAGGTVNEAIYYEALAELLGLPYLPEIDPEQVVDIEGADTQLVTPRAIRLTFPARPPQIAMVPAASRITEIKDALEQSPSLRAMLAVTTPYGARAAIWRSGQLRRVRETTARLFEETPEFSARVTLWGRQGFYTGLTLASLLSLAVLALWRHSFCCT